MDKIIIKGARQNNLKNISLELPKNKLIVMTGVSGSGKSSLAFDTIYAEGQRRYIESLSAYARQFIGNINKPEVDSIEGLSPSISIDQKAANKNPRSTVGTITEIYDYLRLLYARIGIPYCPIHHKPIKSQSIEEMTNRVLKLGTGTKIEIIAPIVQGEKGTFSDLLNNLIKSGYPKVIIDGVRCNLGESLKLAKTKKHNIELIIDRITVAEEYRSRIFESIETSTKMGNGKVIINRAGAEPLVMSENYACLDCNYSIGELEPRLFSFNGPYGACPDCKGLGSKLSISVDLIIPDRTKSILEGAILPLSLDNKMMMTQIKSVAAKYQIDLTKPIQTLSTHELDLILNGTPESIDYTYQAKNGNIRYARLKFEGIVNNLERRYLETKSNWIRDWLERYMIESECETCHGARLKKGILAVYINHKNIYELTQMTISELKSFIENLKLTPEAQKISALIIKEILNRLNFLIDVGLSYLSLNRAAATLSGGESQRIRLATQIGSQLSGVLYVLDEPSIGLHQRDNTKLINSLKAMRDLGNTLIVVEHDQNTILAADYVVDIGPGAGQNGGKIVVAGSVTDVMNCAQSITGNYLSGRRQIEIPAHRRTGNGKFLLIRKAAEHNLKKIDVKIPLGKFICVTGVSGSGKSSLINEVLYKMVAKHLYNSKLVPGKCQKIENLTAIDKVVLITQDPIGRTPRSNPATYVGVFDNIRKLFAQMKESKIRGYNPGRFSFNVKGGRCEACQGDGVKKIEMHFLPDVYVPCDICHGKRYNQETLTIKFKGLNIADVLNLRVSEALTLFANVPKIKNQLQIMVDVGLAYIKLGQSALSLSGGEAARVKLAKELQKKPTGKSLFILDEPTTGLHFEDIKRLLSILNRIVANGDTVIVVEHNLDVIKVADYIIDLGPEGGNEGGQIVATGTPEVVAANPKSYTGVFLKKML